MRVSTVHAYYTNWTEKQDAACEAAKYSIELDHSFDRLSCFACVCIMNSDTNMHQLEHSNVFVQHSKDKLSGFNAVFFWLPLLALESLDKGSCKMSVCLPSERLLAVFSSLFLISQSSHLSSNPTILIQLPLSTSSPIISGVMPASPSWAPTWAPGSDGWLDCSRRWQSSGQLSTRGSKTWKSRWETALIKGLAAV